jgi:outer membrane lipoprotein-sorting protein
MARLFRFCGLADQSLDKSNLWRRHSRVMMNGQRDLMCLVSAVAVATALFGCSRSPTTVDDVIERHTKAMGGRAAIEAIQSIEIDLHIADPKFEVDGTYFAARPGKMRIDINAGGEHVFTEAFDGQKGWQWEGKGSAQKAATEKATAALRHGVELPGKLFGLHELKARGHRIELDGRENIDGIQYYVMRLTLSDSYLTTLYVDPKNWLITRRRDVRPLHVDVDPTPTTIEQRSSNFRTTGGVKFSFASSETDLQSGKVLETTVVRSVKINPALAPSIFEKL